jgi:ribose 5-phosphate isomerase B
MKRLLTELDIINLHRKGASILPIGEDDILTPLAQDRVKALGIKVISKEEAKKIESDTTGITKIVKLNKVAIGSDHTGFRQKAAVVKLLIEKGFEIIDVGTYDEQSCDYPDFAYAVAIKVKERKADFGIILDATGIPSAITANKVNSIRAATCYNEFSARSAREHNNANILVLGAKTLGEEVIKGIIDVWLNTSFGGGRHQKRLNKIEAIENGGTFNS